MIGKPIRRYSAMYFRWSPVILFVSGFMSSFLLGGIFLLVSNRQNVIVPNYYAEYNSLSAGRILFDNSAHHKRRLSVVIFGDSLTERGFYTDNGAGWIALLSNWWSRKADVYNRGYGGYNTRWASHIFEETVIPLSPDFLILFFGANDAVREGASQHVPVAEYERNIETLIMTALKKSEKALRILLITPPPADEEALQRRHKVVYRRNNRTKMYADAVTRIGQKKNIVVLDLWTMFFNNLNDVRHDCYMDGLHFSAVGNMLLFKSITALIMKNFPVLDPSQLALDFPDFKFFVNKTQKDN